MKAPVRLIPLALVVAMTACSSGSPSSAPADAGAPSIAVYS